MIAWIMWLYSWHSTFLDGIHFITGITSIFDLAEQTDIAYGTAESSAPAAFFATQQGSPYRQMYEYMKNHNTFVPNSTTGINRVRDSYGASKGEKLCYINI